MPISKEEDFYKTSLIACRPQVFDVKISLIISQIKHTDKSGKNKTNKN